MRILLTGVSGQVGGALRMPLGAIGTVVALSRSPTRSFAPRLDSRDFVGDRSGSNRQSSSIYDSGSCGG